MAAAGARLAELRQRLYAASGCDTAIDRLIVQDLDRWTDSEAAPAYTASVDRCLELTHRVLPGWHWHLGYGATGVFPYAMVQAGGGDGERRFVAMAPTVPLALLRAVIDAKLAIVSDPG